MAEPITSSDRGDAIALLSAYSGQMEGLMEILSREYSMTQADKARATEMYRTLKDSLKEDCRRLSRKESQGEATHIEVAFLLPAVCDASVQLRPATNTNPITSRWYDVVYSAKDDIDHFLWQLKRCE